MNFTSVSKDIFSVISIDSISSLVNTEGKLYSFPEIETKKLSFSPGLV